MRFEKRERLTQLVSSVLEVLSVVLGHRLACFQVLMRDEPQVDGVRRDGEPEPFLPDGGTASGHAYSYLDRSIRRGVNYTYRLQAVKIDGTRAWLGTAVARR